MKARECAWKYLCDICIHEKYSNLVLRQGMKDLTKQDKAFVTQIVYGTLQNYRYVRYLWEDYVDKQPCEKISILLDMSIYQLVFMDKLPSYAIVHDAVEIAKKIKKGTYSKLVNAVLRNVMKHPLKEIVGSKEEVLALKTSHPLWIVNMWESQYGWENCEKICQCNLQENVQTIRVNSLKTTKEECKHILGNCEDGYVAKDALRYFGGNVATTSYYKEGFVSIQDEASQLVAYMVDPQRGERILDVCSAPGTKATHMAQLMHNEGYLLCGDIHPHRVQLIEEGAKRLGISIMDAKCMDATDLQVIEDESFDRVLCDVPCSGYGVLGRKSDIKYHMKSHDMDTLIPIQYHILRNASRKVKAGGILVYSTCTLNKKENEKQVELFLKEHEEFKLLEEQTIFPFTYHSDGFYMAKLRKGDKKEEMDERG